ncbi:hypothetical protein [Undibacterium sp.]|jgi:hypothetical protein|uniref:hypothetical protein n=1 Tax=Undibacterium sp. TaxID=1914977 RepID=UPI002D0D3A0C|nr:hypothetical protein [Undibacterium sp.]HTD05094.1 hypothetical protein [Undibacterium sp.]
MKEEILKEALLREAFMLGFMVSREGFNGELLHDELAPSGVHPDGGEIREFRQLAATMPEFRRLQQAAVRLLVDGNIMSDSDAGSA